MTTIPRNETDLGSGDTPDSVRSRGPAVGILEDSFELAKDTCGDRYFSAAGPSRLGLSYFRTW